MKLSFSTLACPDWTWTEVQATAVELGYQGVELHGSKHEPFLPSAAPFLPKQLPRTKQQLDKIRLQISALSTGALLQTGEAGQRKAYLEEVKAYIKLAAELGVDYVLVRGDQEAGPGGEVSDQLVLDALMELGDFAIDHGVYVLIKTNGVYTDTARLAALQERLDHPAVGVAWDVHHTYRFGKESFAETWGRLQGQIKYIQLKDSIWDGERVQYRLFGEGDLPFAELLTLLHGGYQGWFAFEWNKLREPALEGPSLAIPHFICAFRRLQKKVAR